ncbi:MAG TPA: GtrA family protein [Phycisphaerales bacterium]|nr:GtrA family protein [Phycisphaerales bacterium]
MNYQQKPSLRRLFDNSTITRYILVGAVGAIIFYGVLFFELYVIGFNYWLSAQISYVIAVPITFKLHSHVTFKSTSHWLKTFIPYIVASFFVGMLFQLSQEYISNQLGLHVLIALLVPAPLLMIMNYLLLRFGVFKDFKNQTTQ